jgi:hypothetical protein
LLSYLVYLLEVFEVTLAPFDLAYVAPLLECVLCLVCMLFFIREEVNLGGIVLEEMCDDAVADTC